MTDLKYSAHLALPQVGARGQQAISDAHIVMVGLGGIGAPAAMYLAGAGVGRLTLIDFDRVAASNLSRQLLYRDADIDQKKVAVAARRLREIAPAMELQEVAERADAAMLQALGSTATAWIDASDNFATRLACNEAALACQRPWVMAAAIRFEGQLAVFQPGAGKPCYHCVYGQAAEIMEDCAGAGVFSVAAGMMGLAAAGQALALACALPIADGLHLFDALALQWQTLKLNCARQCPACGT